MSVSKAYKLFKLSEKMFRCPVCSTHIIFENQSSLVCINRHCFDLSKNGYINFNINSKQNIMYTKDLFESRRFIFNSGFYDPVIENIKKLINQYSDALSGNVLFDAGCGEGFFISSLTTGGALWDAFALDISKEAVKLAAKENGNIKWMVGDLSNIPLLPNTVDILLNIFSPANYGEFLRVMNAGGIMIKVVPGKQYLIELRQSDERLARDYSNEQVLRHFQKNMVFMDKIKLCYEMTVTEDHMKKFARMTPMMFNADADVVNISGIEKITIDVDIVIGKRKL